MNQFIVAGRLGQDPEVKYFGQDQVICRLVVATSMRWKDKETREKKEKTEWHRIAVWGKRGEALGNILQKGDSVCVRGHLETKKYQKKGIDTWDKEMIAEDVTLLGGSKPRGDQGQPQEPRHRPVDRFPETGGVDDDIPF